MDVVVNEFRSRGMVSRPIRTYVIGYDEPGPQGIVKIGQTNRTLRERLNELQTGSPWRLRVLWSAAIDAEAYLHEYFAAARLYGEWFRLADVETRVYEALGSRPGAVKKTEAERQQPTLGRGRELEENRFGPVTVTRRPPARYLSGLDKLRGVDWVAITTAA